MKLLVSAILLLGCVSRPSAQQELAEYDWERVAQESPVAHAQVVSLDGHATLKIINTNDTPLQVALLTISNPPVSSLRYAVLGRIKYENVRGDGYLEMWNCFPPLKPGLPEGQYFSRTLGVSGEMGKISGTSDWRKFTLPFDRTGASGPPTHLDLNLFLSGRGTVYLGSLRLVEYPGGAGPSGPGIGRSQAWWSSRQSGLIGGILGSFAGILGGVLGCLAGSGKARRFVLLTHKSMIALGWILLAFGIVAVANGQPYHVWYPLLLGGGLATVIFWALLPIVRKRYNDLELRRIASVDVR
jgi:hypothetical protein